MKISITFRHMEPADSLKSYVSEKLDKLNRLAEKSLEANVVLSREKHNRLADITLSAKNFSARGEASTSDMMASIDGAVNKVEKTLRRHKGKKTVQERSYNEEPLVKSSGSAF